LIARRPKKAPGPAVPAPDGNESRVLPVLPVRHTVLFPLAILPLNVGRERSIQLLNDVMAGDRTIAVVCQKEVETEEPKPVDLHEVGSIGTVLRMLRFPDNRFSVLVQGVARVRLAEFTATDPYLKARVETLAEIETGDVETAALAKEVLAQFERLLIDEGYFEEEKSRIGRGAEAVWQSFIEEHPWIVGSALAPQFLHSWSRERLEQTVVGSSIAGPGKRPDAILRTAGAVSAVVFAEVKHHRTDLLAAEYRSGCWQVSGEVAGGVAQCQGTVDEAQDFLGKRIDFNLPRCRNRCGSLGLNAVWTVYSGLDPMSLKTMPRAPSANAP